MAEDAFMWLVGGKPAVEGETTDDKMKANKAFELTSYSFGGYNQQNIGSGTSGAGAGKGEYNQLSITKDVDRASMTLFQNMLSGAHFEKAFVLIRRAGGDQINFLEINMLKVFVANIDWSGSGGMLNESVVFGAGSIETKYTPQKADGKADTPVAALWSKITNTPEFKV